MHRFEVFKDMYAVCRLNRIPEGLAWQGDFLCLCKAGQEISLVCRENQLPLVEIELTELGWRVMRLIGEFAFSELGILAKISDILAKAKISIFVISTYNTDFIMLKDDCLEQAIKVLSSAGYIFEVSQ